MVGCFYRLRPLTSLLCQHHSMLLVYSRRVPIALPRYNALRLFVSNSPWYQEKLQPVWGNMRRERVGRGAYRHVTTAVASSYQTEPSVSLGTFGVFLPFFIRASKGTVPKGFERFASAAGQSTNSQASSDKNRRGGGPPPPPGSFLGFAVFLVLCALWNLTPGILLSQRPPVSNEITVQSFLTDFLAKGFVERVEIVNKEWARVILRAGVPKEVLPPARGSYSFRIGSLDFFEKKMEMFQRSLGVQTEHLIPVQHVHQIDYISAFISSVPTILIGFIALLFVRRLSSAGAANDPNRFLRMGKANPVSSKDLKVKAKFSDVAGMKEAKNEIKEFVDFLRDPKKFQHLGAHIPKGALLVGPPGTGKTLLAKAVAGEANVPFFSMSGSDFIEVFVGVGPSRVRDLFAQARKHAPSIIFIDEIDAVGRKRNRGGFAGGANDERENTLNQMLVEMDGFTPSTGVVVLAGTNRADILDPALTRPGRFDRTVTIEKPDLAERTEIFAIHMQPLRLDSALEPQETYRRLAALTPGFVGADIRNICNEAAIMAARRNATAVGIDDLEGACEKALGGLKKTTGFIDQELKRVVAYHEAGHAVTGWFMRYADPVLKVSIVPRTSGALGFAQNLPDEVQLLPQQQVRDKIAVLLGGRVSEELNLGRPSTGASDDLDKVTKLAYAFVSVWGFNPKHDDTIHYHKPYSEELAKLIDEEVRCLIDTEYQRVKSLLLEKSQLLKNLADRLLEQETITFADLREVLGERPYPVRQAYSEYVAASPVRKEEEKPVLSEQQSPLSDAQWAL